MSTAMGHVTAVENANETSLATEETTDRTGSERDESIWAFTLVS